MKQKIIFTAILAIVMLNALTLGVNITTSPEYTLEYIGNPRTTMLSQDQEYNISTYMNYAEATLQVMLTNLVNITTGEVFQGGSNDWTGDPLHDTTLASYYWAISALSNAYYISYNETYKVAMSRAAIEMVSLFMDPTYPGFYVNQFSGLEIRQTKRPGVQAYAYWALEIAESTNTSLDFTAEKSSALRCLTDMLYDPMTGGFYFYTMRNGSINVPSYFSEVYPNNGKRLDHLVLGATALYDAGLSYGNTTMLNMADQALSFMLLHMKYYHDMQFMGFKLAVNRMGGTVSVDFGDRVAHSIVTDLNAMVIRALLKGYGTTGNTTYLAEANQLYETLLAKNWDGDYGGWYTEVVDGEPYDPLDDEDVKYYKYSEIQLQMILALEVLYETTDSIYPLRLIIDTLELVLGHLWDVEDEGFVSNGNQRWEVFNEEWEIHYTTVQAQAVLGLKRIWSYGLPIVTQVRISPTNPRPQDVIYFSVIAFDDDGIDFVFINFTIETGNNETHSTLPLSAHPSIGGLYNNTMDTLQDNTEVNFEVVANDTTGRMFVAGNYHFNVRIDTFSPIVELHAIYPTDEVRVGDDVVIDMETYEFPTQSHTTYCELWWRQNSASYTQQNMTPMGFSGDRLIWRISLGEFNAGDKIDFFSFVMDESGNIGESRIYVLTILGPAMNITPFSAFQIAATLGLIAAPGVGYVYARSRKRGYSEAQRDGKKAARKRARRRGPRRRI
jgi:hypothetical protein